MTDFTRFKISVAAALVFSMVSGQAQGDLRARKNIFFPSQAIRTETETKTDEPLTIVKGSEKIEVSFRIVEVIRSLFK